MIGTRRGAARSGLATLLLAVGLAGVPAPAVAADPVVNVGGKVEVDSPGHLQVRVRGTAVDPDVPGTAVTLQIFVHDGNEDGAFLRNTDAAGNIDVVLPSDRGGAVGVDVWALDRLPGGQPHLKADGKPHAMPLRLNADPVNVVIDTIPPVTTITSGPPAVVEVEAGATRSLPFTFVANEAGSSFTCSLNGASWSDCGSPFAVQVGVGEYELRVRAKDPAGVQGEPVSHRFSVVPATAVPGPPGPGTTPGSPAGEIAVKVAAVKKKSRLRVRVSPGSAEVDYAFVVQKKVGKKWRKVKRSTTRKAKEQRVLDLRRGRYRVVVPAQHGMAKARSRTVRLRR